MKPLASGSSSHSPLSIRAIVAMTVLVSLPAPLPAGVWTSLPPDGGSFSALAIDPQNPATVYAGTAGLAFRTTNGAASWAPGGTFSDGALTPSALVVDPTSPARLYAAILPSVGHPNGGIHTSADGGASWTAINNGIAPACESVAVDPASPSTLYAGCDGAANVFRSIDGGASWTPTYTGTPSGRARAIVIDPSDSSIVYAGTPADGAVKTTNGGASWIAINTGLPSMTVHALAIDPATPGTLYAAPGLFDPGVYKSLDGGATWAAADTGLETSYVVAIVIDPGTPSTLYAVTTDGTVAKSVDGAGSWAPISGITVSALAIDPVTPATLYAAGFESDSVLGAGVIKSTDAGLSWSVANTGLRGPHIGQVIVHPTDPSTLYVLSGGVLLKSIDTGATWTMVDLGLGSPAYIDDTRTGLALEPGNPSTLYYAAGDGGYDILKSMDDGTSWTPLGFPSAAPVTAIAVDPVATNVLYAGTAGDGIYKSTNAGASWVQSFDTLAALGFLPTHILDLAIDPLNQDTVFAALSPAAVVRTTDGGANWVLREGFGTANIPSRVAIDPVDRILYVGIQYGVLRSTDLGNDPFVLENDGLPSFPGSSVYSLVLDPSDPRIVHIGTPTGVYRETGGADNWSPNSVGLPAFPGVFALAFDPSTPSRIYAGTLGHGLFVYTPVCGDGVVEGEGCDDGNTLDGDCCSSTCQVANVGQACDDGNDCTTGEACAAGACASGTPDPGACIDHYLCYKTKATTPFTPRSATLADQFESRSVEVQKPKALCLPANKNGEGIHDPATHEKSYQIKPAVKPAPRVNLLVEDQFGTLRVDAIKPDRLLVPTTKGLGSPPAPPAPGVADHYQCYKARITPGTAKFPRGVQVLVSDQFTSPAKRLDVKRPRRLCNPVDKNGEGIERATAHLMCYRVKPAMGQPKHVHVVGQIHTQNQFGAERLDTIKEEELCVPAVKTP